MKLIYFNRPDCPENMGISQLTDNLELFIEERKDILKAAFINDNKLFFLLGEDIYAEPLFGYALIFDVPNDFNN